MAKIDMAKFAKFCKDSGFIFQSSEIYGGINGFWDYGPLGVELKKNIKDAWWTDMVRNPPPGPDGQEIRMVGLDCSIIMNPKVWVASGHVGGFSDPMASCKSCNTLIRADQYYVVGFMRIPTGKTRESIAELYTSIVDNAIAEQRLILRRPHTVDRDKSHAELVRITEAKLQDCNPEYSKTVQAGSCQEAQTIAALTSKEKKELPGIEMMGVFPLSDYLNFTFGSPPCPNCGEKKVTEPRAFNLMFESHAGAIQSEENKVYLRPETAQGIFANFKNVLDSTRLKLPFGVGQIGKAFRNEINPRNYIFRSREFEQMEIEFFCHPAESMKWYEYWRDLRKKWYSTLGISSSNLVPREQAKDELAHYSIGTTDIEYMFPFSDEPQELEGVAHRGSFDLNAHATASGMGDKLAYFDQDAWMADAPQRSTNSFEQWIKTANPTPDQIAKYKFFPHVIEPSAGADRFVLAVLCEAFTEDSVPDANGKLETRTLMKFHPRLAPIKAAIFPLVNKEGMPEKAMELYRSLKPFYNVFYDASGAVGRRYRRQDEVGTPFCITIDGDTMTNGTVTIRDRDTTVQRRIPITDVKAEIDKLIAAT